MADYPTLFSGIDMAYYVDSIQKAVKQRSSDDGGNLMLYFDEERNPNVKAKTLSAIPSVEIRGEPVSYQKIQCKEELFLLWRSVPEAFAAFQIMFPLPL